METYEGAEYNEGPLDEAEKILKQLNRQFPQQAKEHEEYLKRAFAEIRYRKAERLWSRAEWRILRGENNSAKLFIDRILAEYADTPFADKAKAAQEKLGELRVSRSSSSSSWLICLPTGILSKSIFTTMPILLPSLGSRILLAWL